MVSGGHVDERLVQRIWERQAFHAAELRAMDLSVVFRGMPSDAGGPDYQEAVLVESGTRVTAGDVEFHVATSDWYRHGHHRDARYNGVILHVVWTDDLGITELQDGNAVPILALETCVRDDVLGSAIPDARALLPHPCVRSYAALKRSDLRNRVQSMGLVRFQERVARFAADLEIEDADQVLYTGLFEALGYASNRDVFRKLADIMPYMWLASLPAPVQASALLEAAGLGPSSGIELPARLPPDSWRLARIRPANHPVQRLRGIVSLLTRLGPSPAQVLTERVSRAIAPIDVRRTFMAGDGTIGAGRADEIAINVALPFVASYDKSAGAENLFLRYPAAPSNRWTRVMEGMFADAGNEIHPKSAAEHQGMHHLYHRHCRYERSAGCPVCGPTSEPQSDAAFSPFPSVAKGVSG